MMKAELHKKLAIPMMYRSEDLLTSSVFGTLMYLDRPDILIDFLRTARNLQKKQIPNITKIRIWKFHFWPRFQNQIEPDLLLQGFINNKPVVNILIEAKYFSTKNVYSVPPVKGTDRLTGDQLTDQFRSLISRKWATPEVDARRAPANHLIYLTNHFYLPEEDLAASAERFSSSRYKRNLYWTSWRNLPEIIDRHFKSLEKGQQAMLTDLSNLLAQKRINRDPIMYLPPTFSAASEKQIHFFRGRGPTCTFNWEIQPAETTDFFI